MAKKTYVGVNGVAKQVSKMYVGVNGVAKRVKRAYIGVNGVAKEIYTAMPKIVTWSSGTLDELKAMIDADYEGIINLSDYWAVGDTRQILLYSMSASSWDGTDSQVSGLYDIVILDLKNSNYNLVNSYKGQNKCRVVFGLLNCLNDNCGKINGTNTFADGFGGASRHTDWLNSTFKAAITTTPYGLGSDLCKEFYAPVTVGGASTNIRNISTYFTLASYYEILGTTVSWASAQEGSKQFEYYKTASHRVKTAPAGDPGANYWWTRSAYTGSAYVNTPGYACVKSDGTMGGGQPISRRGLATIGVM